MRVDNIQLFNSTQLEALKAQAKISPRRRANLNVHQSYDDKVQRLFIAMYPDSYVRPHRHIQPHKWEFFMVVEGAIDLLFFDNNATLTKRITLEAGGECVGLEIPPNVWHATVCYNPVVFMEVKQGPYEAMDDKGFAAWAPSEGDSSVPQFLEQLKSAVVGTQFTK